MGFSCVFSSPRKCVSWWCLWACLAFLLLSAAGVRAEETQGQTDVTGDNVIPVDKNKDPPVTDLLYLDVRQKVSQDSDESKPLGTIVIGLFGTVVPKTVENFKGLAPVYEQTHTLFHRVIPGFVIQARDIDHHGGHSFFGEKGAPPPKGADPSKFGPMYSGLEDENFILSHNKLGRVSVANAGPNTGGSQFFVCMDPQLGLDGKHVVFGQVLKGMNVAEQISHAERDGADRPLLDIFIQASRTEPYTEGQPIEDSASTKQPEAPAGAAAPAPAPAGESQLYIEDHPSGMGGSYHHHVFVPFTVFLLVAGYMAYRNRRNVSMLVRGPRYRRVSGINV